jgi:hypothetical protein
MGGRVVEDGACAKSGGNVDNIVERNRAAPMEVDLEARGAWEGGKMYFMVGLRMLLFCNGLFKSFAGVFKRRGKLIAVELRSLMAVGTSAQ